jgi:hypothetical protein
MTEEELKIVITGDVADGVKGISAFDKAASELTKTTGGLSKQISDLSKTIPKAGAAGDKFATATKNISKGGANANMALTNLGRVASDLPFGFIAIQNNIDPLIQSFQQIFSGSKNAAEGLKAIGAALTGAGGLALGITLITSTITTLIQKYGNFSTALLAVTGGLSNADKAQSQYNKSIEDGVGKVAGEVSILQGYLSIAKDESISREQRLKAIKEIQKDYPNYLSNINLENINSQATAAAIDKLTGALTRKAKIQAASDLISAETTKILKAQNLSVAAQANIWDILGGALKGAGSVNSIISSNISSGIRGQAKTIDEAEKNISSYQKTLNDLLKVDAQEGVIGLDDKKVAKSGSNIKTIADVIKELNKDLVALDVGFAAAGGSLRDLSEDKIKRITDALKELSSFGVLPGSTLSDALTTQIKNLQSTLSTTPVTLQIPIKIDPLPDVSNATTIANVMKGVKDQFRAQVNTFTQELNTLINKSTQSGIESLAEGIGTALATGDIGAAVGGFVNAISGFLSQLGKLLIVQGVAVQAFQTSLDTLQGIPAIIAGGALIAASAAFKALAGKGVSSFATGGTVFGPTLAMIGDNPGREEHIVPSEVLDKLGSGGGFPERIELFARGTTLSAVLQRGNNTQRRING